jgi:hypothetical protein
MKNRITGTVIGLICLAVVSIAGAQQASNIPAEVCQAIEQFVARVNSAGVESAARVRQEQYDSALNTLATVVKRHGMPDLLNKATEFANATEAMAVTDSTNARFSELVSKKLKAGEVLQEMCMPYTTSR